MLVKDFAKKANISPQEALEQMRAAGLSLTSPDDVVNPKDVALFIKYRKQGLAPTKVAEPETSAVDNFEARRQSAEARRRSQWHKEEEEIKKTAEKAEEKATEKTAEKTAEKGAAAKKEIRKKAAPAAAGKSKAPASQEKDEDSLKPRAKTLQPGVRRSHAQRIMELMKEVAEEEDGAPAVKISPASAKPEHIRERKVLKARGRMQSFQKPSAPKKLEIEVRDGMSVRELAGALKLKVPVVERALAKMGSPADAEAALDATTAVLVTEELGHAARERREITATELIQKAARTSDSERRPPVIAVMGHVDHGKTTLLDAIRKSRLTEAEAGGITQRIGAYCVNLPEGELTFIDTPGHSAFSEMRARGAQCTDIVVLVVAADDGVMPQSRESIEHAKKAGVPLVVAINKMDAPGANPDKIQQELASLDVISEKWGGQTPFVEISALEGRNIDKLLEALLLQAEIMELRAPKKGTASGVVLESRLDPGRGAAATLLVMSGELSAGQIAVADTCWGKIRTMCDENGKPVSGAVPCRPVEVFGLDGMPAAGVSFSVVKREKEARQVVELRRAERGKPSEESAARLTLEQAFENMGGEEERQILRVLLKADTAGSLEAISAALAAAGDEKASIEILSSGVGGITASDVDLAADRALLLGFNVRADAAAKRRAEALGVTLSYFSVIYELLEDMEKALKNMLVPETREEIIGIAEVREVFRASKFGDVAGCMVSEGVVRRNNPIRVLRDNVVIFEGGLESLRRFKENVAEVRAGTECGIGVRNYKVQVGDQIEVFEVRKEKDK